MRRLLFLASALALTLVAASPASAELIKCGGACTADFSYTPQGGETQQVTVPVRVGENGLGTVQGFTHQFSDGAKVTLDATLNPDPAIIFAIGAGTGAVPAVFAFGFSIPIALSGPISASSSLGYTLTDGFLAGLGGAPGITVGPFGANMLVANDFTAGLVPTNKGVDIGPLVSGGVAPCGPFVVATSTCGPFAAASILGGGPYVLMGVTLSFVLTPLDTVGLSGSVTQTPGPAVPEPATLLLLGSGMLGLAARRRRSSRG